MSLAGTKELNSGLELEKRLHTLFASHENQEFVVIKQMERVYMKDHGIEVILEAAVVTFKTKDVTITSNMRYRINGNDELDFLSDLIANFFEKVKNLMLFNDKLILVSTGFSSCIPKEEYVS